MQPYCPITSKVFLLTSRLECHVGVLGLRLAPDVAEVFYSIRCKKKKKYAFR